MALLGSLIRAERVAQNMSQEALCVGICAVSYLSKIENGQVVCSDVIYERLFDALGLAYVSDPETIETFDREWAAIWDDFLRYRDIPEEREAAMLRLAESLTISPRGIDALIARATFEEQDRLPETLRRLSAFLGQMNAEQAFHFFLLRAHHSKEQGRLHEAVADLERIRREEYPIVYSRLSKYYFVDGQYEKSVEIGMAGYQLHALEGNVRAMLDCMMFVTCSYGNLLKIDKAMQASRICRGLNEVLCDAETACTIEYNEGGFYEITGQYEKSEVLHRRALELADGLGHEGRQTLRQKCIGHLAFTLAMLGKRDEAEALLGRLEGIEDEYGLSSELIRYILSDPDFRKSEQYCLILESCHQSAKMLHYRGTADFYGRLLVDAYKKTRRYKQAMQFIEKEELSYLP